VQFLRDINTVNTRLVPVPFEYHCPDSLEEALKMLGGQGGRTVVLAGGTDLLVKAKQRSVEPSAVVSIRKIPSLADIEERSDGLHIGAAVRMVQLERSDVVRRSFPLLAEAASAVGSIQIRHMATIGGNLCNASPAADGSVALLALNSTAHVASTRGMRSVPLSEFFLGPGKTVLAPQEILTRVSVPYLPPRTGTAFARISRTDMDLAKVNVATALTLDDGKVSSARVALGAVAPTVMRAATAERVLVGGVPTDELMRKAADEASEEARPITDVRSTAEYRKRLVSVLVRRTLVQARDRAGGATE
jgi:carbon-monoxide dehydrogenase medium subunit